MLSLLDDIESRRERPRRGRRIDKPAVWPLPKIDGLPPIVHPVGTPTTRISLTHESQKFPSRPTRFPVFAVHDGVIAYAGEESDRYSLIVDHGDGWAAHYSNLESVFVTPTREQTGRGERVRAGDALGYVAESLHFELWRRGDEPRYVRIDPRPYMDRWLLIPWIPDRIRPASGSEA